MTDFQHARATILCLINSAAFSRLYFTQLQPYLEARGYSVVFALDSHLTDVLYADGKAIEGAWYFSDFIREHSSSLRRTSTSHKHTWGSLFSDFDRFLTMEIAPPLNSGSSVTYAEIPSLLDSFFDRVFSVVKPCGVLYEQVSNSFAIHANLRAKKEGIPFCSMCQGRISGRIEISMTGGLRDDVAVGRILAASPGGSISEASRALAADFIKTIDEQIPDYMKAGGIGLVLAEKSLFKKYVRWEKIKHVYRSWLYRRRFVADSRLAFQHGDPIVLSWAYVKRALKRRIREKLISRLYRTQLAEGDFFLYPLHYHPEASTSIMASDYVDELALIKAIAFRLPTSIRLFVKEHPSAIGLQPLAFYRQLAAMPNVVLLSANVPTKKAIRKSKGVICLTSTVGFEAAVLNKPVVALGDVIYGYYPNVRLIRNYSELDSALDWAINYVPVPSQSLLEATAAYVEFTEPGSFDFTASSCSPHALATVADLLTNKLSKGAPHKRVTNA